MRRRSFWATTAPNASIAPQRVALRSTPTTLQPPPDFPEVTVSLDVGVVPVLPAPPPAEFGVVPTPTVVPPVVDEPPDADVALVAVPLVPPALLLVGVPPVVEPPALVEPPAAVVPPVPV